MILLWCPMVFRAMLVVHHGESFRLSKLHLRHIIVL
jgi:hypothetical protein